VTYLVPNKNRMLKQRSFTKMKRQMELVQTNVFRLIARRAEFNGDTQKLRGWLILDLKAMNEECQQRTKDQRLTPKQRQKWTQLMAQISRVLTYVMKEFDAYKPSDLNKEVDDLAKLFEKLARKTDKEE